MIRQAAGARFWLAPKCPMVAEWTSRPMVSGTRCAAYAPYGRGLHHGGKILRAKGGAESRSAWFRGDKVVVVTNRKSDVTRRISVLVISPNRFHAFG